MMIDLNSDTIFVNILILVSKETGIDCSHYQLSTIKQKVEMRVLFHKLQTIKQYAKLLSEKPEELMFLCQEILFQISKFFSESETFIYLKKIVLPRLLSAKSSGEPARIWIPACGTGEEVYTLAITILEILSSKSLQVEVKIFATDISAASIRCARKGEYPSQALTSVSKKQLNLYFTKTGNNYIVSKMVKDLCVFAQHNIWTDPPFSRVDLVSNRIILFNLNSAAKKRIISTFHFALNKEGFLILNESETTLPSSLLFSPLEKKLNIYTRKSVSGATQMADLFLSPKQKSLTLKSKVAIPDEPDFLTVKSLDSALDSILLSAYIPACVMINSQLEILQFRGNTSKYFSNASGKASFNILKMLSPEIALLLPTAISQVIKSNKSIQRSHIEIKKGTAKYIVNIEVVPIKIEWDEPLFLVLFYEQKNTRYDPDIKKGIKNESLKDLRIQKLEDALAQAYQNLLVFTNEQEGITNELKDANEEIVSSNEELQILNEELGTSKEEIESWNEKLSVTNQELLTTNQLLYESYQNSDTIINTMHDPLLILDKDLRIKSTNKAFHKFFKLTHSETLGVLMYELGNKAFANPELKQILHQIILKNTKLNDFELTNTFHAIGKKILLLNAGSIIPKRKSGKSILLVIHDITETMLQMQQEQAKIATTALQSQKYNEKLEILVSQRTSELSDVNKLLEQNLKTLEKINEELHAFAFAASHDLQEPLRKIQTFTKMILENDFSTLSENGKNQFESILYSTKRMRKLIQDLIAYSEINAIENGFEKTDLETLVHEVVKDLEDTIANKKAVVEINIKSVVNIIPFQIRQLIHNLMGNALKFTKPGHPPHITIRSTMVENCILYTDLGEPTSQSCCHITFKDEGIGFDMKYSSRIFTVFQKLHSKDEFSGSGIGLAIVKKVIQNHHGTISAKSTSGKGTTFDIYIPS